MRSILVGVVAAVVVAVGGPANGGGVVDDAERRPRSGNVVEPVATVERARTGARSAAVCRGRGRGIPQRRCRVRHGRRVDGAQHLLHPGASDGRHRRCGSGWRRRLADRRRHADGALDVAADGRGRLLSFAPIISIAPNATNGAMFARWRVSATRFAGGSPSRWKSRRRQVVAEAPGSASTKRSSPSSKSIRATIDSRASQIRTSSVRPRRRQRAAQLVEICSGTRPADAHHSSLSLATA